MSKKDKKRQQKKARSKRGVLPSSVQALLGYLGGGGPAPAQQGDTKLRERAGVDAYDTLHQIIKSQQLMSANYMANLERMAFKNEITDQLKKQGEESKKAIAETKTEVGKVVESAVEKATRSYVKRSPEEKIDEKRKQIEFQLKKGPGANQEIISKYEADIKRYQGLVDYRRENYTPMLASSINPDANIPSASGSSTLLGQFRPSAGGGKVSTRVSLEEAQSSRVQLPAIDPRGGFVNESSLPPPPSKNQEIEVAMQGMTNPQDITSSSGTAATVKVRKQPLSKRGLH